MTSAATRAQQLRVWRARASAIAATQHFVLRRSQLKQAGIPRWFGQLELRAGRWQPGGRQTLITHNGPVSPETRRVAAVAEVGAAAALDGVSALQYAGVEGLRDTAIVVSTPRGSTPRHPAGVTVRETRRFHEPDVMNVGCRVMRPAAAAIHAALWAVTDKQATLFVTLAVQQRLTTIDDLLTVLARVRRHKRRRMLARLLVELGGGAGSLGELDVCSGLRRRGLPEPVRQSVRQRPNGRWYLDLEFLAYNLVVEIDGAGHDLPWQRLADLLRDLTVASEGRTVIRIPLVAWRLDEERVLDALEQLFAARGWQPQTTAA